MDLMEITEKGGLSRDERRPCPPAPQYESSQVR